MNRFACQYAIIRFLPYAETGEFANVGAVLACPAAGYLDARLMSTRQTRRITGFFEQLEKHVYRGAMTYLNEELNRVRELVYENISEGTIQTAFADLTRPRESLFRFSDTRVILAEQPDETLSKLFARFVDRDFANKTHHNQVLERKVREMLRRANLRNYFKPATIGNDDLHIQVPFVHLRDGCPQLAINPLNLAKDEPNKVFEQGGRWVERVRRLGKHRLLPERMLFAVKQPHLSDEGSRKAADEIIGELREMDIEVATTTDAATITAFAAGAVNH